MIDPVPGSEITINVILAQFGMIALNLWSGFGHGFKIDAFQIFFVGIVWAVWAREADHHSKGGFFAIVTEEATGFLPYEVIDRRVRYDSEHQDLMPSYRFLAGDVQVDATVFPLTGLRQPPNCPVEGGPMRRARGPELQALLWDQGALTTP